MKLPIILALTWFVAKIVALQIGFVDVKYGVMLNVLLLVIVIFLSIRKLKKNQDFFSMVKSGMRPAVVYIMVFCLAVFVYYKFIDQGFLPGLVEQNVSGVEQTIAEQGGFEAFKKDVPAVEANSLEEYLEHQRQTFTDLFAPLYISSGALLVLTMLALLYTLLLLGVQRLGQRFIKE